MATGTDSETAFGIPSECDAALAGQAGRAPEALAEGTQPVPARFGNETVDLPALRLLREILDDGRICLTNSAAERALRPLCLGRKSWFFAGSDRGGTRAAVKHAMICTAKLNGVDPQAWLADVLARIADMPQIRLHELLPWHRKAERRQALAA